MATEPDLRRLGYFVAVAETLHYGHAAAKLQMSAPPLSQRIRELERTLGLTLFTRTSRKVELTEAGVRLLGEARRVLAAAERFRSVAATLAATEQSENGVFLVGFCHGSEEVAMVATRRFHDEYPGLSIRPQAMTTLQMFDLLLAEQLRVAIVRAPIPHPQRISSRLLTRVAFDHVAVPKGHRLAARQILPSGGGRGGAGAGGRVGGSGGGVGSGRSRVVRPRDLDGEALLLVSRADAPTYHDATIAYCAEHGINPRWVEHGATQVERMLDMVSVGAGIGWLNQYQAAALRSDYVAAVPLRPVTRYDEFHLAWRVGDDTPAVRAFVSTALSAARAADKG